ncbi:MAG: serine/threonine-protein kinase [Myxococcota bacterium]
MAVTEGRLEGSEDGRAFLQQRVATAGLFGASIGGAFLVFRVLGVLLADATDAVATYWFHLAGVLCTASMWVVCRRGARSVRIIRLSETCAIGGGAISFCLMGLSTQAWLMPHHIIVMPLTLLMFARAIYVPSSAKRTLTLCALVGVPILCVSYFVFEGVDISEWDHIEEEIRVRGTRNFALGAMAFSAAWWTASTVVCTAASWVIYGLRKNVRDAKKLGQYDLKEKLGEGGMGMVFRAEHAMLRRPTAIKLLPPEKVGAQSLARFEKEVQQTARLTHPNTVTIFDYGRTPEGVFYYAMELLDGITLRRLVEVSGAQSVPRAMRVFEHAARALAEAHGEGLIHRDIKPANLMLVKQGGELDITKVLDFGLVKELRQDKGTSLTQADSITGTPQYLSPEAIKSPDEVDARSDLYALGAVIYYLLAGDHVFSGGTVVEVCSKHLYETPRAIGEVADGLPDELGELIMQCLAKDPADRPKSASAIVLALEDLEMPAWTQTDARGWWDAHRRELRAAPTEAAAELAIQRTIDVDVARRASLQTTAK